VGVVGKVTGEVHVHMKGTLFVFPKLTFETVRGREMRDVVSVVSVFVVRLSWGSSVDVLYDPENPALVSRPFTVTFLLRPALSLAVGMAALLIFAFVVLINLPL